MQSPFLSRRSMLTGMAASAAALSGTGPALTQSLPADPDVVIIGAGAAGLAAGRALALAGISHVIVEAADRVGGRAWTESTTFGVPFDQGCSWISGSDHNSITPVAREGGFTLVDHSNAGASLFDLDGAVADYAERRAYDRAWGALEQGMTKAAKAGRDVPALDVIPRDIAYSATSQSWMGAMDYGVDFDKLSVLDWWESAEAQPSYLVHEGLGAVIATLARDLPIALRTPVRAVDYSGSGVRVETARGTLHARVCLVTVSTGVLNAGAIRFTPALPAWKQQAAADIPMGLLVKVPLMFDGARLGIAENNWVTYRIPEGTAGRACYFVAWPTGHDYIFGNIGGSFGWELSRAGVDATVDYALGELVRLVGSDARKHFAKGYATEWADNPLTRGAYGALSPGRYGAREMLAEPLADRLFFAGEAMGGVHPALVNGAHDSGRAAGRRIAALLG